MSLKVLWQDDTTARPARELDLRAALEVRFADAAEAHAARDWPDVLVCGDPSEEQLDGARLRRVVVPWAGVGARLRERALARPHLTVHNSHFNDAMVAQHALALLLAVTNRVVAADRAMRRGDWGDDHDERHLGVQLAGKVALLVGYGAIGRALRPSLEALGMEVRAYRRRPRADGSVREYGPGKLHEALAAADAVVVSLPATPDTEGLLGAAELARLKPTAALVNVGRGKVIDEEALYRALDAGRLLGAGIDVWYRYPKREPLERVFPSAYPFQELDNVVMSPHRGNDVRDWQRVAARDVLATLTALAAGEERNRVDLESGY